MLSRTVVEYLSSRVYRSEAERTTCILPYCGICWDDELPDLRRLIHMSDEERRSIFRLFGIRLSIWNGVPLAEDDEMFWDEARVQAPKFALFHRLTLSTEDRVAQELCELEVADELQALCSSADEVTFFDNEHGEPSFSATFNLSKGEDPVGGDAPWWRRRLRWPFKRWS